MSAWTVGWRFWALCALVSGLLGWALSGEPPAVAALVKARRDEWSLPPLPRRFDQTSAAGQVLNAGFWGSALGAPTAAAAASAPEPRWRIAAIFGHGPKFGVLLVDEANVKPDQKLWVGDSLPDGKRIVAIAEREVSVRDGKKIQRLGVEPRVQ